MKVTAPQEIGDGKFKNKNWDQASRAAGAAPNDVDIEGAMHLTKRGLAFFFFTGKSYLSNFYLVEF